MAQIYFYAALLSFDGIELEGSSQWVGYGCPVLCLSCSNNTNASFTGDAGGSRSRIREVFRGGVAVTRTIVITAYGQSI